MGPAAARVKGVFSPIEVRGARPGHTLAVHIGDVVPRDLGRTRPGAWCCSQATATTHRATARGQGQRSNVHSSQSRTLDLDGRAAEQAAETMLDLMERELGATRRECLALASVVVGPAGDPSRQRGQCVHALLRDGAIR